MNELCDPGGRSKDPIHPSMHPEPNDRVTPRVAPPNAGIESLEPRLLLSASTFDAVAPLEMLFNDDNSDSHADCCANGFEAPDDDFGNDAAGAELVQIDTTIFGAIEVVADQDWFTFQGQAGIQYTFSSELFSLPDSQLVVYDTDGVTVLAFDDDSGPGLAALLTWTAPTEGMYYLALRGFDLSTGTYGIEFTDNAVPTGEIHGTKWYDLNEDGIRDANEPGLEGWMIFVDSNNNRKREIDEQFAITDANGDYALTGLRPGTYTIAEKIKPGWTQMFPGEEGAGGEELLIGTSAVGVGIDGTLIHYSVVDALGPEAGGLLPETTGIDPIDFVLTGKWPQPDGVGSTVILTYSYSNLLDGNLGGSLTNDELIAGIEESLAVWATYAPLKFVLTQDSGPAPSDSSYPAGDHPLLRFGHHSMDGPSNVLAHAFTPGPNGVEGDVHFDTDETWTIGPSAGGFDFIEVAVHEIGHALGLLHENTLDAIMNPIYASRFSGPGTSFLLPDDVNGIQALYGELASLAGAWTVTLANRGDIVEDVIFGNFLNDDFGDGIVGSTSLGVNSTQTGIIESFGDLDWFSYDFVRGVNYNFGAYLDGIDDTVITLYDRNGIEILSTDDDGGPGLGSLISWVAPEDGTYYVEVRGFTNSIGGYQLQTVGLAGDLNNDGLVGIEDLTIALGNWNNTVTPGDLLMGDPTFDGFVGIEDLNMILSNWNARTPPPPTSDLSGGSIVSVTAPVVTAEPVEAEAQSVERQAVATEVATADQARQRQRTRSQRQVVSENESDGRSLSHNTQAALAAWYRGSSRNAVTRPMMGPAAGLADLDEPDGSLGLWDEPAVG